MGQLVAGGEGNVKIGGVGVDVGLHGIGEEDPHNLHVGHGLREKDRLHPAAGA